MDILKWTREQNIEKTIAALELSDDELLEGDETHIPLGEEEKARLLEELREERRQFSR